MISINLFGGSRRSGRRAGQDRRRADQPVADDRRSGDERRARGDRRTEPRR